MKKLLSILVVCCLLVVGCNNTKKQIISSDNLQGRYEIDLSAVLSQLTADEDNDLLRHLLLCYWRNWT